MKKKERITYDLFVNLISDCKTDEEAKKLEHSITCCPCLTRDTTYHLLQLLKFKLRKVEE